MRPLRHILLIGALTAPAGLHAQGPPSAQATAITTAPTIDGRLDEAVWGRLMPLADFTQREPSEGQPVSQRTEVRVAYDDDALYIGASLFDDDVSSIVVGQTLRDASLNDSDAFVMVLDTYLDRQNGFVFGTTPAGIEYDGQVSNEGQGGGGGGEGGAGGENGGGGSEGGEGGAAGGQT